MGSHLTSLPHTYLQFMSPVFPRYSFEVVLGYAFGREELNECHSFNAWTTLNVTQGNIAIILMQLNRYIIKKEQEKDTTVNTTGNIFKDKGVKIYLHFLIFGKFTRALTDCNLKAKGNERELLSYCQYFFWGTQ